MKLWFKTPCSHIIDDPNNNIIQLEFVKSSFEKDKVVIIHPFKNRKIFEYEENNTNGNVGLVFRKMSFDVLKNIKIKGQINNYKIDPYYQKVIDSITINKPESTNKYVFLKEDILLNMFKQNDMFDDNKLYVATKRSFSCEGKFSQVRIDMYNLDDTKKDPNFLKVIINDKRHVGESVIKLDMKHRQTLEFSFYENYIFKYFLVFEKID